MSHFLGLSPFPGLVVSASLAILLLPAINRTASATTVNGLYWSGLNPKDTPPAATIPPGGNNYWKPLAGNLPLTLGPGPGATAWFGLNDSFGFTTARKKSIDASIGGTRLNLLSSDFIGDNAAQTVTAPYIKLATDNKSWRYHVDLDIQPDAEWFKLTVNSTLLSATINTITVLQQCYDEKVNNGKMVNLKEVTVTDPPGSLQLTQLWFWSEDAPIDTSVAPTFDGPSGSGNWSYTFVSQDPYGNLLPSGGVEWTTDGAGVLDGDTYSTSYTCLTQNTATIDASYFDLSSGQYLDTGFYCPEPATLILFGLGGLAMMGRRRG